MSAMAVASTAMCQCTMGKIPVPLNAISSPKVLIENKPAATIMDKNPMANIPPFGLCSSPANPAVAAASGTPMPCVPVIAAPWMPGQPKVLINNKPALTNTCKCICNWGGVISITNPGTTHTQC